MKEPSRKIKSFTDLETWQEGHRLVLMVYQGTEAFPQKEVFGLVSQMRKSVVSVTSNITEGFSRQSYKEKVQFYFMAKSSLTELQNQLIISRDVSYLSQEKFRSLYQQSVKVRKLLNGLIRSSKNFADA